MFRLPYGNTVMFSFCCLKKKISHLLQRNLLHRTLHNLLKLKNLTSCNFFQAHIVPVEITILYYLSL